MNIIHGRAKGYQERVVIQAHQSEVMARQKKLKPLKSYLASKKKVSADGSGDVLAMFEKMAAEGKNVKIRRLKGA